jgi:hypothetical protein
MAKAFADAPTSVKSFTAAFLGVSAGVATFAGAAALRHRPGSGS